jgi:three-Cys-motif partner protein
MSSGPNASPHAPRPWGYWTQVKLQILSDYLNPFLTACQGQDEVVYLDAFAGEGEGISRVTGETFSGSAVRALVARSVNGHQFTRLRYFERETKAAALEDKLRADHPDRDIKVYGGDCNTRLRDALSDLADVRWAPTFAFVDPDGLEVDWNTLRLLASHKHGSKYKTELWLLFSSPAPMRVLGLNKPMTDEAADQVTRLFGSEHWRPIHELRKAGILTAEEARNEFVNLMRWRLEQALGYQWTHPLLLKTEQGAPVYHMIFATDNAAGNKIMSSIYTNAASIIPDMAREAREYRPGAQMSFGVVDNSPVKYEYLAPSSPPGVGDEEPDGPGRYRGPS